MKRRGSLNCATSVPTAVVMAQAVKFYTVCVRASSQQTAGRCFYAEFILWIGL